MLRERNLLEGQTSDIEDDQDIILVKLLVRRRRISENNFETNLREIRCVKMIMTGENRQS
jgi:hypothetical protein